MVEFDPADAANTRTCPQCNAEVDQRSWTCGYCSYKFADSASGDDDRDDRQLRHRTTSEQHDLSQSGTGGKPVQEILLVVIREDNYLTGSAKAAAVKRLYEASGGATSISLVGGDTKQVVKHVGWPTLAENWMLDCSDAEHRETIDTIVDLLNRNGDGCFAEDEVTVPREDRVNIAVIDETGTEITRDEFHSTVDHDDAFVFVAIATGGENHYTEDKDTLEDRRKSDSSPPSPPDRASSRHSDRSRPSGHGEHPLDSSYDLEDT